MTVAASDDLMLRSYDGTQTCTLITFVLAMLCEALCFPLVRVSLRLSVCLSVGAKTEKLLMRK